MDAQLLAGILIIIGFVIFWVGNLTSPPGVYSETDTKLRLKAAEKRPLHWALSQGLGGVGIAVIFLGLLVLSIELSGEFSPLLAYLPAALNIVSVILISIYLHQYISDPVSIWEGNERAQLLVASLILVMIAGTLYGILFVQADLPKWLGYLTVGYCLLAVPVFIIFRPPPFYVISLYFFVLLGIGISLVR